MATVWLIERNDAFAANRSENGLVRPDRTQVMGQVVGTSGNAPRDTPHLHFQLMHARFDSRWWDGDALDPRAYFVKTGERK